MQRQGKTSKFIAAVDIGGTKVTVSLINKSGILSKVFQPVRNKGKNTAIPDQVDSLIKYLCSLADISPEDIGAVGVSTPSPFEKRGKYKTVITPNICGGLARKREIIPNDWKEVPLEKELASKYPELIVNNDCLSAVTAERTFGAGRGEDNLAYVTWSTGIGAGAYVDGRLISGKNGNAMHFGHIPIIDGGPQCGCSCYGHLEALSSGVAIARDYKKGTTTKQVFKAYERGDKKSVAIVREAAKIFGRALSILEMLLDTKLFIIGGSVFQNNQTILMPLIKKELVNCSYPTIVKGVEIVPSALEEYLGDLAALSLVIPSNWVKSWQQKKPWKKSPKPIVLDEEGREM